MPVAKIEAKRRINHMLAKLLISGMINLLVRRQMAGRTQYAINGIDVRG
jgi:hypothetical protein